MRPTKEFFEAATKENQKWKKTSVDKVINVVHAVIAAAKIFLLK